LRANFGRWQNLPKEKLAKRFANVSKATHSGVFYPNENYLCGVCGSRDLCRKRKIKKVFREEETI